MTACNTQNMWEQFLQFAQSHCSKAAFGNWLAPIRLVEATEEEVTLEIPNIFVQEYLLSHYKKELCAFLPLTANGEPAIRFVLGSRAAVVRPAPAMPIIKTETSFTPTYSHKFNPSYRFENFIEGAANQFVKSAAIGVATRPGQTYNLFVIHGGVGLGKTLLLGSIWNYIREHHKKLRVQYITTEAFVNELVDSLRNKTIDKMKRYYRSDVDVLLVDDIQFLQNRLNFEEELCNTFEALILQNKQVVIASDKPPGQLKLSERMTARMEWGLVAHLGVPELETRVAILQHKAKQRGLEIPSTVAFYIAEHLYNNVRQLEGAVNRLSAQCRMMDLALTEEIAKQSLAEMFQHTPKDKITVEQILQSVSAVFQVRLKELKSSLKTKEVALARQVAMYLACKFIKDSLQALGASFGKTHPTLLHACKVIEHKMASDETLRRQIQMVERHIAA